MKKRNKKVIVKKKINIGMLVLGVIVTIVACNIGNSVYIHRVVRYNGQLLYSPIVHIDYKGKGGNAGDVEIDGKKLHVMTLDNEYSVGDSLLVRYDKERQLVIQEKFQEYHFVMWFALDAVLLIGGLILTYGGLAKKSWDD